MSVEYFFSLDFFFLFRLSVFFIIFFVAELY